MAKLQLTLNRKYKCSDYTIGRMQVGSVVTSDTLEDRDRGLTSDMSIAAIKLRKIFGKTAIPTGTYRVKPYYFSGAPARGCIVSINSLLHSFIDRLCVGYWFNMVNVKINCSWPCP